jgi:hypothetical protein
LQGESQRSFTGRREGRGETYLEKLVGMVEMRRERSEKAVERGGGVAGQEVDLVQFEDGESDAEEEDSAVDEEEVPDAAARASFVSFSSERKERR